MSNDSFWKRPVVKGLRFGLLTLLFSYLPTLIVCLIQWVFDSYCPSFEFAFSSGGMISIWIPILVMLLFSFYELHEYNTKPGLEGFISLVVLILLLGLTALFPFFFFKYIQYAVWVKWASYAVIFILFISLCISEYLESTSPKDLQSYRADDQKNLENKANKL